MGAPGHSEDNWMVVKIRGYIGIMKKNMETTIMGYIVFNIGLYGLLSKLWYPLGQYQGSIGVV